MPMMRDTFSQRYVKDGRVFLTNLDPDRAWAIEQAAKETEFRVEVRDSIGDDDGYVGVWTLDHGKDHGPFWERFVELLEQEEPR